MIKNIVIIFILSVLICGCEKFSDLKLKNLFNENNELTEQTGKYAINPQYSSADNFSEGLAAVRIGDDKTGKWGFIDKTGKLVISPQFDSVHNFSEELTPVRIGDDETGKWGFIDKSGKLVISPQFDAIYHSGFSEGLASVRIGDDKTGKWGFISRR